MSNLEIFYSKWFDDGLITNQEGVFNDFNSCDIGEVKKLAELYKRQYELEYYILKKHQKMIEHKEKMKRNVLENMKFVKEN